MTFEERIQEANRPRKMSGTGTCKAPATFNYGQLDRNGRNRAVYSGCCDAARDYRAERRTK